MVSKRTVFFKVSRGGMPFHLYRSFYNNNLGIIFYQKRSLATLVWFLSDIYTHDKCRLLYHNNIFHIAGSTHKKYEASPLFWLATETVRDCCLWPCARGRSTWSGYFWAISAMKSQKTAEESHNKENIKNPRGFIVLQTQMSFSLGSGNR